MGVGGSSTVRDSAVGAEAVLTATGSAVGGAMVGGTAVAVDNVVVSPPHATSSPIAKNKSPNCFMTAIIVGNGR